MQESMTKTNNSRFRFRAWDKISKKMLYPVTLFTTKKGVSFIGISAEILNEIFNDSIPPFYIRAYTCHYFLQNNFEVMQWTGLTDRDGKPIFEGDIVITKNKETKATVIFDEGVYFLEAEGCHDSLTALCNHNISIEVIGNIFENNIDKLS